MTISPSNYFQWRAANRLPDDKDIIEGDELITALTDNGQNWDALDSDLTLKELSERYFVELNKVVSAQAKAKRAKSAVKRQGQRATTLSRQRKARKTSVRTASAPKAATPAKPVKSVKTATKPAAKKSQAKAATSKPKPATKPAQKATSGATQKTTLSKADREKYRSQAEREVNRVTKDRSKELSAAEVIKLGNQLMDWMPWRWITDAPSTNKRRLAPTEENLKKWVKQPGRYDLIGVDAAGEYDVTVFKKRDADVDTEAIAKRQKEQKEPGFFRKMYDSAMAKLGGSAK